MESLLFQLSIVHPKLTNRIGQLNIASEKLSITLRYLQPANNIHMKYQPCPGMRSPESLTPASRFIMDSIRSPEIDPTKLRIPKAAALR